MTIVGKCTLTIGRQKLTVDIDSRGKNIVIQGPTGAGKSTLLRFLTGLNRPANGKLMVNGETWQDGDVFLPTWNRNVGWVPQNSLLMPHMRVMENLLFGLRAEKNDALNIAKQLGIDHLLERWPRNLSGGERQRVALGRALVSQSKLLLLDEPFSALDVDTHRSCLKITRSWTQRLGATLILVSHQPNLLDWVDEFWSIDQGTVVQQRAEA